MDKIEALKQAASDPRLSQPEREAARAILAEAEGSQPRMQTSVPGGALAQELLCFAGAAALEDVPPSVIVQFADDSTADPEALKNLCADWHLMRTLQGYPVADETWNAIKRDYATDPERRLAFERITQQYLFLGPSPVTLRLWQHDVDYLAALCAQRGPYDVRTHFVPQIRELLVRLPEYAFAARDDARSLLDKYQNGENHDEHRKT